jgi:hypothetical protein
MPDNAITTFIKGGNTDLIFPPDVASDYDIPETTQAVWRCTNRYGWRDLTIKLGRRIAYRRTDIEAWLESRRGMAA